MKTALKSDLKSKTYCISKSYSRLTVREARFINLKSYQKLFVLLISISIFLIFQESPRELGNICESYNSKKICNVW